MKIRRIVALCTTALLVSGFSHSQLVIQFEPKQKNLDQAVVYLESKNTRSELTSQLKTKIVQRDRLFHPYIEVVTVGTQVAFPNEDPFAHHVYSFSKTKPFELPLYQQDASPKVTFDKPGVVILGCNIHDWMLAYLIIVDTPYYGKVSNSEVEIEDVNAGDYTLNIWHPTFGEKLQWKRSVNVTSPNQVMKVNISENFSNFSQPQPESFDEHSPFYD